MIKPNTKPYQIITKVIPPWIFRISLRKEVVHLGKLILYSHLINMVQQLYFLYRKSPPYIHIIGDSHIFSFTHPLFKIHYIAAATAHNLNKENSTSSSKKKILKILKKINNPERKLIILLFGEIDCRVQIYYHYKKSNGKMNIYKFISQTVKNYTELIMELQNKKFNPAVLNVVPPGEQSNIYHYSYYANRKIRLQITKQFNYQLKIWCHKHNVPFIEIFDELLDNRHRRKKIYRLDKTHYKTVLAKLLLNYIQKKHNLSTFLDSKNIAC